MEQLPNASSALFLWLIDYTGDISILICLIFLFKLIAGKKFQAWWHYSIWLILMARMVIPWEYKNPFNVCGFIPASIKTKFPEVLFFDEKTLMPVVSPGLASMGQGPDIPFYNILLLSWIAGVIIFGVWVFINNTRFRINIKNEPVLTHKKTLLLLKDCMDRMGIKTRPEIIITDKVKSPSLFGYFKPRLLLPEGILESLSEKELFYIFMHELGHLKHHDIGVSWIMTVLQVIHWFNPFVWFAFYRVKVDQETACDEYLLSKIKQDKSYEYADSIVVFLDKFSRNRRMSAMAGILENKSQIKRRLAMIIKYKKQSKKMKAASMAVLIAAGFLLFTVTGSAKEEVKKENPSYKSNELNASIRGARHNLNDNNREATNLIITIKEEGEFWVEGRQFNKNTLLNRLVHFNDEFPKGNIVFVTDKSPMKTTFSGVLDMLDIVRKSGVENVVVAIEKK